jgi:AraC-like DNA-binding protein
MSVHYPPLHWYEPSLVAPPNPIGSNEYRIEKAKEMLLGTSFSVGEIAEKAGYVNANYFYTLFKKVVGFHQRHTGRRTRRHDDILLGLSEDRSPESREARQVMSQQFRDDAEL